MNIVDLPNLFEAESVLLYAVWFFEINVPKGKDPKTGNSDIKIKVCHNRPILPFPSIRDEWIPFHNETYNF